MTLKLRSCLIMLISLTAFVIGQNVSAEHSEPTQPGQAQVVTLIFDGLSFSPAASRERVEQIPLREEVLRQSPSTRLDGLRLARIEILAKSIDYSGSMSLWIDGRPLMSAVIPQSMQFDAPYPTSFAPTMINVPESNPPAPSMSSGNFVLRLEGNVLRVLQITLTFAAPVTAELVCKPRTQPYSYYPGSYALPPTFQIFNTRTGAWIGVDGVGFGTYPECQASVESAKNGLVCVYDRKRSSVPFALYSTSLNEPDSRLGFIRRFRALEACVAYLGIQPIYPPIYPR